MMQSQRKTVDDQREPVTQASPFSVTLTQEIGLSFNYQTVKNSASFTGTGETFEEARQNAEVGLMEAMRLRCKPTIEMFERSNGGELTQWRILLGLPVRASADEDSQWVDENFPSAK